MTRVDALNLLESLDLPNFESLVVKSMIKGEFQWFFVILTRNNKVSHKLDNTSGFSLKSCIKYSGTAFFPPVLV